MLSLTTAAPNEISPALQATLTASGIGLYSFDPETDVFAVDATCRKLFDIDPDTPLSPEVMLSRIHPDDVPRYWAAAAESVQTGNFACDYRVIHRDGSVHFVSGRGNLYAADGSKRQRLLGVCVDVTARHALEAELQATQARMQHLADGVPGLFAYLDRNYIIRFLSSEYDQWYGYSRARHLNEPITSVITPETWLNRKPLYDRCLAGEIIQYEESRLMASGEQRFYAVTYQPDRNADGEVVGILSLAMDITDRRAVERALEQKSEELERSNRDLEQFAYVASHDLKAPLRAIEILVEWLQEDLATFEGGEVQQNLGLLKQRTARLHRLLDDLMAYSRAARKPGEVAEVDTRLLVTDLFTLLAPPASLRMEASASLPLIRAHQVPLEQVLRNLINNAIKHHPTKEGRVRVYAQDKGGELLFAVEDDGAGIPQEYAEKVFQMFQTLQPRDDIEGSGMGLAIVKRIVEWQGGRIWFHGGPGGCGTVFKFTWKKLPGALTGAGTNEVRDERPGQDRTHLAG
ncbi:MAG: PAS domain-containing sensor histidine kinase [Gammaproteobacteria bacterium]